MIMEETIAAVSTAYGEGGIGIVRMSGENSREILGRIFSSKNSIEARKLTYGEIKDPQTGELIDEVLAVYMPAPHTYTTEDVVEIDCHGSIVSLRKILSLCLREGARPAERGEFTKRAFLGGRLDLSQAEAVIDLIKAKTDRGFGAAMSQLEGLLSDKIKEIRKELLDLLVEVTVNIDYPDEDIEILTYEKMEKGIVSADEKVRELLNSSGSGRIIREGLDVAIIGKPNVGKSSLMNALLKESRAIVTDIPGTTRDTIQESVSIDGIPVRLTDTAGIRSTDDTIEQIGIERSKMSADNSDLVIFIVDRSEPLTEEDLEIAAGLKDRKVIVLANKQDLPPALSTDEIEKLLPHARIIGTALSLGEGVKDMEEAIKDMVFQGSVSQENSLMVTNVRHENLLTQAAQALEDALEITRLGEPPEIVEIDIRRAYEYLGEIIGEEISDDIINEVFSRFCLGK